MVEFLKEAGAAIRSFHAIHADSCGFTAQINDRHSGYWIRCKINKPILALNQPQNIVMSAAICKLTATRPVAVSSIQLVRVKLLAPRHSAFNIAHTPTISSG